MFLKGAQNLQTLRLHRKGIEYYRTDFLQSFRPSLPKLSRLDLHNISTTKQDLIETLLAYRATLTKLCPSQNVLIDGGTGQPMSSWYHFFRWVPKSIFCLLGFRLRHLEYCLPGSYRRLFTGRLELPYLKTVDHAVMNGIDIPQLA